MLTINIISNGGTKVISGSLNGERFNVPYCETVYAELKTDQELFETIETQEEFAEWTESVKARLVEKDQDIIETACPDLKKDPRTGKYFIVVEGAVSKKAVPQKLVDVILESIEKNIDPMPIIKAWVRFLRNPNFSADKAELFATYITATIVDYDEVDRLVEEEGFNSETAKARATYNDVAITQEGQIVCKKYAELQTEGWTIDKETNKPVSKSLFDKEEDTIDPITGVITKGKTLFPEYAEELTFLPPMMGTSGDEFMCAKRDEAANDENLGHVIKVGMKHTLKDWNQVNCNDYTSCVKGLHVGGWQYVQSYNGLNCQLLECFVDPMEIGALCDLNRGDGAIRVREYFVYGAVEGRTKGIYHSSKYAAIKDAEWEEFKKEAIKNANERMAKLQEEAENLGL